MVTDAGCPASQNLDDSASPLVTVIMPVRNEEDAIQHSLGAVLAQDYCGPIELLVADGVSEDRTRAIVCEHIERISADQRISIRIVDNPAQIMAAGFNSALKAARGEVIIMLGGHTEIAPDYVTRCVAALKAGGADCVGGPIETVSDNDGSRAIARAMSSVFGVGGVAFRTGGTEEQYVDTVAFGAYTRDIIERCGHLDEELVRNQDDEYNYRLRKLGARILLVPGIKCRYVGRSTLRKLWRQYFGYGFWKVRVMQKHPLQMQLRQFAPAAFVAVLICAGLAAPFSQKARILFGTVLSAYTAANLASSIIASHDEPRLMALLPPAFVTLHFAYGTGFLAGLVNFRKRWNEGDEPR